MPIDASIYGQQHRPLTFNPFEGLSQMLHIRNQQAAGQAINEQRRAQADLTRQKAEQERADAAAAQQVRALFGRVGQDGTPQPPTPEELASVIGPEKSADIFKGFEALREARTKNTAQDTNRIASVLGALEALPAPMRGDAYTAARQQLIADGTLKPGQAPEAYDANFVKAKRREALSVLQQFEQDKKPAPLHVGNQLVDPETMQPVYTAPEAAPKLGTREDYIKRWADSRKLDPAKLSAAQALAATREFEAAGRAPAAPKDERLVQIQGPTGTTIWVRESEAVGKPAAQAARGVTGAERQALSFYNRAADAIKTLTEGDDASLEQKMAKQGLAGQAQLSYTGIGSNLLQTAEQQQYRQAQRAFTEARLRKESGAAIPTAEYENDARTYFVQPGDSPAVVAQKKASRQKVLDGLAFSSGKAYDEFYGEPRANPNAPKDDGDTVDMIAPDGRPLKVPKSDVARLEGLGAKRR